MQRSMAAELNEIEEIMVVEIRRQPLNDGVTEQCSDRSRLRPWSLASQLSPVRTYSQVRIS